MTHETENYLEDVEDTLNDFEGLSYYGSDGKLRIKQWLASGYITSVVGAAVWLEKQQRRVNKDVESNPFAQFDEMQADAVDEILRQPEERYDDALPKAQYFWNTLSEKQRPLLSEIGQRFMEGRGDEAYYKAQASINGLTREEAEKKRKASNIAMNAPFTNTIVKTLSAITGAQNADPFFTKDDWFRFLDKIDRYCETFKRFYLGDDNNPGKDLREMSDPEAWAADVTLIDEIHSRVKAQLEHRDNAEAQEVPEPDKGAFQNTIPEVH